jgi:hypothetical protein
MFYYSTVDGIVTTHGPVEEKDGIEYVHVHFERPNKDGFDFADAKIPHFTFDKAFGFSEDELLQLTEYMRDNSSLIWEFAGKGGGENA